MDEQTKTCTKCGEEKPVSEFHTDNKRTGKLTSACRVCRRAYAAAWKLANPEKTRAAERLYQQRHPDRVKAAKRRKYEKNRPAILASAKAYQDALPPEKRAEYLREWRAANPGYDTERARERRSTPRGKLDSNIRSGIHRGLAKGAKAGRHTYDLLGYTLDDLMSHIEKQFEPWMSWENHAMDTWHIDHIRPLASFTYSSPDDHEFREAWALKNLQPLAALQNQIKHAKWTPPTPANDNVAGAQPISERM